MFCDKIKQSIFDPNEKNALEISSNPIKWESHTFWSTN